jgi:ppGpp synthetase/RelA/SpoT-type nucleotidyltranferase
MEFIRPDEYSRKKVDRSGQILIGKRIDNEESEKQAIDIFNNWRASHAYPMHVIMKTLKNISKDVNSDAICVQRLKRAKSILKKLERFPTMQLSQIQDIGGCRVVMPDVNLTRKLSTEYIKRNKRHKRVKSGEKNYINTPKPDGYRSIHLVYKYHSINKVGKIYNGKSIEIQIRSKLQHVWATALETVDLFTFQTMKLGGGYENWKYFFKLVSSAFAMIEKCPIVPNTPLNKNELYAEIKRMAETLNVAEKMKAMRASIAHLSDKKDSLFLLILDTKEKQIGITSYINDSKGREKATQDYSTEEAKYRDDKNYDVVLVVAENMKDLKNAYPNYLTDTDEFLKHLQTIIEFQG